MAQENETKNFREFYDAVIVGAGPAGMFAARTLADRGKSALLIDKGRQIDKRICPLALGKADTCCHCDPCNITSGIGGAGTASDGKLTLTPEYGGNLEEYIGRQNLVELIDRADKVYVDNGASTKVFCPDAQTVSDIQYKAIQNNIEIIPAAIRHMGTDKSKDIIDSIYSGIKDKCDVVTGVKIEEDCVLLKKDSPAMAHNFRFTFGCGGKAVSVDADNVIFAVGREGSPFMEAVAKRLKLETETSPVDIGVRVEVPAAVTKAVTDKFYELKAVYNTPTYDDRARTFCMCPNGEVTTEYQSNQQILTVNGHSNRDKGKTENTNFAILISSRFTEPFNDPIGYGSHIARLANMLSGGIMVQRLGDLLKGRRSNSDRISKSITKPTLKSAVPGDLSYVLPHRYIVGITEMLKALDTIIPGIYSPHTLLYGVEVKFYSLKLKLDKSLMTTEPHIYAIGDGAGVSRGVIQASASGIWAGEHIK